MLRTISLPLGLLAIAISFAACGGDTSSEEDGEGGTGGQSGSGGTGASAGNGGNGTSTTCTAVWAELATYYADAGTLGACTGERGALIADSMMNLEGLVIDNNGADMNPCLEVQCDADYAYIVSNDLPHYDFVQTTPNALAEDIQVYRIPLTTSTPSASGATNIANLNGCEAAYDAFFTGQAPNAEPAGFCTAGQDGGTLTESLGGGQAVYSQILCLGSIGTTISGVNVNGPNEGTMPDPYGNPGFAYPDAFGETYGAGAALDLCGGHTGGNMHYHAAYEACFATDADGKPTASYVDAVSSWTQKGLIEDTCTEESKIVGWAFDGYPIKGPCVCVSRDDSGNCTSVKRARSAWLYRGLSSYGSNPQESAQLGLEGSACESDDDCCPGGIDTCNFGCNYAVVEGGNAGTDIVKQCTLLDYAWCTSAYVDRTTTDTSGEDFVYMDRCNGHEDPDGYAYHATGSFPLMLGCYHGVPTAQATPGIPGGGMNGGGMNGGGMNGDMNCQAGQTSQCCGDGTCDGPETAANCAADCG
ncbi:MAG: YHYH protein [Myxococcales bacterium]|nr:YHYH protein [Myxococcales bacterium]